MCMYNITLNDELVKETRRLFESEAAMKDWLQQQVEALLMAYNSSHISPRQKARLAIMAMRRQSEENGNSQMTLDEINNEIQLARQDRKGSPSWNDSTLYLTLMSWGLHSCHRGKTLLLQNCSTTLSTSASSFSTTKTFFVSTTKCFIEQNSISVTIVFR